MYEKPSHFQHFQCHFLSDMHIILQRIYVHAMLEYDAVIFVTVESQGGALWKMEAAGRLQMQHE